VSGSGAVARSGFARLTAEVALGHVGLVLGLEVSRLARNNADWYRPHRSGRDFVPRFLQTVPRGSLRFARASPPSGCTGLSPPDCWTYPGHRLAFPPKRAAGALDMGTCTAVTAPGFRRWPLADGTARFYANFPRRQKLRIKTGIHSALADHRAIDDPMRTGLLCPSICWVSLSPLRGTALALTGWRQDRANHDIRKRSLDRTRLGT
jgi:hypothetical protein